MTKRMIFYLPRRIEEGWAAASQLRPRAMLKAFRDIGFEVTEVIGGIDERLPVMRAVRRELRQGGRYDFIYMESATLPLHRLEPRLRLLYRHPFADIAFLARCRRAGIPVGIFYRDIHWRFPHYRASVAPLRRWLRIPFYVLELALYERLADVIFLPHSRMADYFSRAARRFAVLPPGADQLDQSRRPAAGPQDQEACIRIIYAGGLGALYDLSKLAAAVADTPDVSLTICCREAEWLTVKDRYPSPAPGKIEIVHESGVSLARQVETADIVSCYLRPVPYLEFAMPMKLFQFLSYGKAILATDGTAAGEFVRENGIGWSIPYGREPARVLLERLKRQRRELAEKGVAAARLAPSHTWEARARWAAANLGEDAGPMLRETSPDEARRGHEPSSGSSPMSSLG